MAKCEWVVYECISISLMSQVIKLILRVLLVRARRKIRDRIAEEQYWLTPGKCTRNAICMLHMLSERAIEMQKDLFVCFIMKKHSILLDTNKSKSIYLNKKSGHTGPNKDTDVCPLPECPIKT